MSKYPNMFKMGYFKFSWITQLMPILCPKYGTYQIEKAKTKNA